MNFNFSINALSPETSPRKENHKSLLDGIFEVDGLQDFTFKYTKLKFSSFRKQDWSKEPPKPKKIFQKKEEFISHPLNRQEDFISKYINEKRNHREVERSPSPLRSRSPSRPKKLIVTSQIEQKKDLLHQDFIPFTQDDDAVTEIPNAKTLVPVLKYREKRDFRDKTKEVTIYLAIIL